MTRVQETGIAGVDEAPYGQWDSPHDTPLLVSYGGSIALDSISRNRVTVSVGEDSPLPSTDKGYTVNVTSQPPNSAILVSDGDNLTVRAGNNCQGIQLDFSPGAIKTYEAAGDARLAPGPGGNLEGYIAAYTESTGGVAQDRLTIQLGGVAVPAA